MNRMEDEPSKDFTEPNGGQMEDEWRLNGG